MLVREVMHRNVLTVEKTTSLQEAYRIMQSKGVRHLPVLELGRLVGVVTDRDLRLATSALAPEPFPPEVQVGKVMISPVITVDPEDPVEEAAALMRRHKIGCLPVIDQDVLVGILTGIDFLDALIRMAGVERPGGRLEVLLGGRPGELAQLVEFLASQHVEVHSVLTYPTDSVLRAVLRVGTAQTRILADELREEGFSVSWPPEKPWSR